MKRSRFTEEQIIGILRGQEAGVATAEVCRRHGVSSAAFNPAGQITGRTVNDTDYVWTPSTGATAYTLNGLNALTQVDSSSVTYDSNRNATAVPGATYGYDSANRLTSANTGSPATFAFDPLGRLYQSSTGGVTTRYQYAGQQLATEYDASGSVTRRYVPGLGLDGVVTAYTGSGTSTRDWLLADERGSVMALTGSTGVVSSINRYDEYGVPASDNTGRFGYTGQPWLAEAGAYHYRARTYLPKVGRFLQTDPIGYQAGANLYAYVGADPVNLSDPLGLDGVHTGVGPTECGLLGGVFRRRRPDDDVDHNTCTILPAFGGVGGFSGSGGIIEVSQDGPGDGLRRGFSPTFSCPVTPPATVNSGFDDLRAGGRQHMAVDLRAYLGAPIFAPLPGTVRRIWRAGGGGNSILIENYDGSISGFAHTAAIEGLRQGDSVSSGQRIGTSDGSGDGPPHLHYTHRIGGGRIDPLGTRLRSACRVRSN